MIILCVSLSEARDLIAGRPDRALQAYLQQEAKMEHLLPDDNLPNAILLKGLELDADKRNYVVTYRTYATSLEAEEAWARHTDEHEDALLLSEEPDPMAGFIISKKLTEAEAMDAVDDMRQWFKAHPHRRICRTDLGWKVRRGHIVDDVFAHADVPVPGVEVGL